MHCILGRNSNYCSNFEFYSQNSTLTKYYFATFRYHKKKQYPLSSHQPYEGWQDFVKYFEPNRNTRQMRRKIIPLTIESTWNFIYVSLLSARNQKQTHINPHTSPSSFDKLSHSTQQYIQPQFRRTDYRFFTGPHIPQYNSSQHTRLI